MSVKTLGLLGDVHAEHHRLAAALTFLDGAGVDEILCTGDVVDGPGCADTSARLLRDSGVLTVRGNHDRWLLEKKARHIPNAHHRHDLEDETLDFLSSLPLTIEIETVAGALMLCHGVIEDDLKKIWPGTQRTEVERSAELDDLIASRRFRYLINGHMHFRTIIHFEALILLNAGTLTGDHWPGFSVLDFASHSICAYEFSNSDITLVRELALDPQPDQVCWQDTQAFTGNWEPVMLFGRSRN